MNVDAVKAVSHTEFLSYHIHDIYTKVFFGYNDKQVESTEDVMETLKVMNTSKSTNKKLQGIARGRI